MEDLHKYRILNKLKQVERLSSSGSRKESDAEHSWGCLMLADYLLSRMSLQVDRLKVYELLMYHDVVEIESGDTPLDPNNHVSRENQVAKEMDAIEILAKKLPEYTGAKLLALFHEFEEQKTREAKFAKLVDQLEAHINELDYKKDWKGWTEDFLRSKKEKYYEEFPQIQQLFNEMIEFQKENDYFDK